MFYYLVLVSLGMYNSGNTTVINYRMTLQQCEAARGAVIVKHGARVDGICVPIARE